MTRRCLCCPKRTGRVDYNKENLLRNLNLLCCFTRSLSSTSTCYNWLELSSEMMLNLNKSMPAPYPERNLFHSVVVLNLKIRYCSVFNEKSVKWFILIICDYLIFVVLLTILKLFDFSIDYLFCTHPAFSVLPSFIHHALSKQHVPHVHSHWHFKTMLHSLHFWWSWATMLLLLGSCFLMSLWAALHFAVWLLEFLCLILTVRATNLCWLTNDCTVHSNLSCI